MRKTNDHETDQKITVDIATLQQMLCVGRTTAEQIGRNAEAVCYVGRRKLYFIPKITAFMETLAGNE